MRALDERSAHNEALYEVSCACDGSYCGGHRGLCGETRVLNKSHLKRAMSCLRCFDLFRSNAMAEGKRKYRPAPEVDDELRRVYQQGVGRLAHRGGAPTLSRLSKKTGRPTWWLSQRASALGLSRPLRRSPEWADEEQRILERNVHRHVDIIRRKLRAAGYERSRNAVLLRRSRQHLKSDSPYFSVEQLRQAFGLKTFMTVDRWIREGKLRAVLRDPEKGDVPGAPRLVHRAWVRRFVQRHPNEFDLRKVDQVWFLDLVFDGRVGERVDEVLRRTGGGRKGRDLSAQAAELPAQVKAAA